MMSSSGSKVHGAIGKAGRLSQEEARALARTHDPTPRTLTFRTPEDAPRFWMGDDAFSTVLMGMLSVTFPGGEEMFIRSVAHFRDQVKDETLRRQVRAFVTQEGYHRKAHEALNRGLTRLGFDGQEEADMITGFTREMTANRTPAQNLAVTCALEHFTAIMAESLLTTPELHEALAEPFRSLWIWHALEELDHKSVAFDVFEQVSGDHRLRAIWMVRVTLMFVLSQAVMNAQALFVLKQYRRPLYLARKMWAYWGPRGHFTRLIPAYLRYYRRDFHPWETDHRPLIERFERELGFGDANAPYLAQA